ncbi:TonB-dependent receptor [Rasiella sp. SM2506]|uniref:TonB-dependent receptor n=1 Tax=Rasiella sp. SM2506 TaxID=3423914 RepID=UPI003D78F7B2
MKNFITLCTLCTALCVNAQSIFKGTVTNQNNKPILATVYLPQLQIGTATDLDGNFQISNLPSGTFKIVYSSLGYATLSTKISFQEGNTISENTTLQESAVEMEEIVISTPFHKLQSDNVMRVERVTASEIKKQGALTLSQGITNIPGVSSITTGVGIGKPVIRGLSANRVATFAQGVRLENQQFGDEHGLGLSANGIESIEVIKGPASLLYGSDALGGVLYINPENFAERNSVRGDASIGYATNTEGKTGDFGVKQSGERFKFLVRGGYATHADYKTGDTLRVTNTRFNETDLKTGLRYQGDQLQTTLRYNFNQSNIGIPEELGVQNTERNLLAPFQQIDNHILSLENNLLFNNSSLNIKAGYLFNNRREFEEVDELAIGIHLNTFNYNLQYHLPDFGNFETIVGVQGMYQQNENYGEEILIPDATTTDYGLFATTHYHLENIDLQGGLRIDTRSIESLAARNEGDDDFITPIDVDFSSITAALGAKFDISEQWLARVNVAKGYRAPNLAELTSNGVHEGTNRYEVGNAGLTEEQNLQADISIAFRNEHFEFFGNGFYNMISDYIFINPTTDFIDNNQVFNYFQTDANLYGGEVGLHIHPHPLDWLHIESTFETVTGDLKDGGSLPLIPANTLKNTLRVEFKDGKLMKGSQLFATYQNTFAQNNVSTFETTTKGYNLLSLGASTSFNLNKIALDLGVNVTNLTDEVYINHLSRLKVDGISNIGRNVNMNLRASF